MQRYFYHLQGGIKHRDEEGIAFASFDSAKIEAVRYFAEVLIAYSERVETGSEWQLTVCDVQGMILLTYSFIMQEAPAIHSSSLTARGEKNLLNAVSPP